MSASPSCYREGVQLQVDGSKIPTIEATTHVEQAGPAAMSRLTECRFPAEWNGEDVLSKIAEFDSSDTTPYSKATVYWQVVPDGIMIPVHHGYVRGVSGTDTNNLMKLWIGDLSNFLSAIPFSGTYELPTVLDVLDDVIREFNDKTEFSVGIGSVDNRLVSNQAEGNLVELAFNTLKSGIQEWVPGVQAGDTSSSLLPTKRTFTTREHTLLDALNWLTEVEGGEWWFDYGDMGETLIYQQSISPSKFVEGESVSVLDNGALNEVAPINAITVNGHSGASLGGFRIKELHNAEYPSVTVQHDPLVKSNGGNQLRGRTESVDARTIDAAVGVAKKKLADRIRDSGEGSMTLYGAPGIRPYDVIRARPECNDIINASAPPLEYEVSSVKHHKLGGINGEMKPFRTEIMCSPKASKSDMSIVEAEMVEY